MIVVRITGGLGNQMFQYAFARSLQMQGKKVCLQWHGHRTKSRHNGWELDDVFLHPLTANIRLTNHAPALNTYAWAMRKTARRRQPKGRAFSPECLDATKGYLDGYWQSERYFQNCGDVIRSDFRFKPLAGDHNVELLRRIQSESCISIHVRRGDYVGHSSLDGVCGTAYYSKAISWMKSKHPDSAFLVFSDDIPYCKNLFCDSKPVFVDWNINRNSWMDMALMSQCRHHIIANSSFSWWGAWLGRSDGDVICPENWFSGKPGDQQNEICPDRWVRMDGNSPD